MAIRNVLIFPAGTEIGLEIFNALRSCKEVRLFGAGESTLNHAPFVLPDYDIVESVHREGWLETLIAVCRRRGIDYIFPAHDDVVVALARAAASIPAAVLTSISETCEIARSKSRTYRHLEGVVRVPKLYAAPGDIASYPVLVKPDRGQGSLGVARVDDAGGLDAAMRNAASPIVCEYLPGEEYTVDCFSDRDRGVLFAGARQRCRMRNGIAMNTRLVDLAGVEDIARAIAGALPLRGAWFFQLKRAGDGALALLEVAPRIAGSMAAHRATGVNFALLSIFEHERLAVSVLTNAGAVEMDRALANRYRHEIAWTALYVDFDDTLILNGAINTDVVVLICRSINMGIPVKLLTRHDGDIDRQLARWRLTSLFDEVIHLRLKEPKWSRIAEPGAILIDDSYAERSQAAKALGIATFDCSMIEMLIGGSAHGKRG